MASSVEIKYNLNETVRETCPLNNNFKINQFTWRNLRGHILLYFCGIFSNPILS